MYWQAKCFIDGAKAILPFQAQLRRIKDRLLPYHPDPAKDFVTIDQGLLQVEWVRTVKTLDGASVLEVGTGWQPMIPILYSLAGASRVFLADLNRLLRHDTFEAALQSLRQQRQAILDRFHTDPRILDHAIRADPSCCMNDRLREMRLIYMAPCDCRRLDLPPRSLDIVSSRAVLEHIPAGVIRDMFSEAFRLLKPGGLMCHIVDNSDHWEHQDKRISKVNFLKFSDSAFRWTYINGLNYQNRLRHPEYIDLLRRTGFRLVREERRVHHSAICALPHLPLANRFRHFSAEDLATTTTLLLAVKDT